MVEFSKLFLLFIIFSFIGFIVEEIIVSITTKEVVNRGFLIGPILPIYGFGALFIIKFLGKYQDDLIVLFILSFVICGTLEYITSFLLEKIYKVRWWDYSDKKYNVNGRITLPFTFMFGLGGVIIMKLFYPVIIKLLNSTPENILIIVSIIIFVITLVDTIISANITYNITSTAKNLYSKLPKDNTDEIKNKVFKVLKDNYFTRRVMKSFPNLTFIKNSFIKIKNGVKNTEKQINNKIRKKKKA